MTRRRIAFQIDEISGLNTETDSSLLLMEAAACLGHKVFFYYPKSVAYDSRDGLCAEVCKYEGLGVGEGGCLLQNLDEFDLILPRQDPPFDINYITNTYLLSLLSNARVVNSPESLRSFPEKLSPLYRMLDLTPHTLISANVEQINEFIERHDKVVVKPLHGYGGNSVFVTSQSDLNRRAVLEVMLQPGSVYGSTVIVQEYLDTVLQDGDRRVLFAGGEIVGCLKRVGGEGTITVHLSRGGKYEACEMTESERESVEFVKDFLVQNDIFFAGIDLIGSKVVEINITSPTGYKVLSDLSSHDLGESIIKKLVKCV